MKSARLQLLLVFLSFALVLTVIVDAGMHLSMAKAKFPKTRAGMAGWINLLMYEMIAPAISLLGLSIHIFGLHLGFVSLVAETVSEALTMLIGTAIHAIAWLAMGVLWTTCEMGTLKSRKVVVKQSATIIVSRSGPAFCPQHKLTDAGLSLEGPIPVIRVVFAWGLFGVTLLCLLCAVRTWNSAKHVEYMEETARHQRTIRGFELAEYDLNRSATAQVIGEYETKF